MTSTHRIESIVRYGIIALGVYLALASFAMYVQVGRLHDAQDFVDHTERVRYALQDTLSLVLDAESSQRGFSVSKNEQFLMDHFSAVTRLRTAVAEVKSLTRDNPIQQARAVDLDRLIDTKIEQLRAIIDFVRQVDKTTAVENFRSGATRTVAGEIRAAIDLMIAEEDNLFAVRKTSMSNAETVTIITFVVLLVVFGGVATAYFAVAARNIRSRNAMLAELTDAKAKTERADKFKGDLLNYLGRALRIPLTQITSGTDLLLYRAENDLPAKDQKIVGDIRASARFLLSLAHNFLHIGRLQAGKPLRLEEDDVDLSEMVRDTAGMFTDAAAKSGVAIHRTASFNRALVRGDKQKLRQILLSLLDNAVKHTPREGRVDVTLSNAPGGDVELRIHDSGPGISAERLQQVMIPFSQIENMFEREEKGIGLGLPLALGFAQAHGGTLRLACDESGTTAILTLPAASVIKIFAAA